MKKLIVIFGVLLILTGCGNKGKITCSSSSNYTSYNTESKYTIYYTGELVDSVETVEIVTSSNDAVLSTYETTIKSLYENMNSNYGGYTFTTEIKDGKLTVITTIDYNKLDIAKLVENVSTYKNYYKNGKLTVEGVKSIYTGIGATCDN